ncbi:hypothetical protein, partial [Snodgrassella sp.]|uniref:hypothetical protein n=1 Tax=Snodgrassella sp. TaxID=2815304 RepID=UPI002585FAAD
KVLSRLTQFNVRTGGALTQDAPRVVTNDGDSSSSSKSIVGMYALRIVTNGNGQFNNLDTLVSGNQQVVDPTKQKQNMMCARKPLEVHSSNGMAGAENVPMCPISFKRLSWREVKTDYNQ